jgi:hypothetical protein
MGRQEAQSMTVNAQYNVAKPSSLPVRIAAYQRRRMFETFMAATTITPTDTVLDVGATSDQTYDHSNYFEAWFPDKSRITAVGIDEAHFLETQYPGLQYFKADGRNLPFDDLSFDHVHSSAVLEHVGSRDNQALFLRQLWRVTRKSLFVTTPNRWFPVEFHTVLPLLHWLPPHLFRQVLTAMGKGFFADENNLNLLSRAALLGVARQAGISGAKVRTIALGGWPTNLILCATRPATTQRAAA